MRYYFIGHKKEYAHLYDDKFVMKEKKGRLQKCSFFTLMANRITTLQYLLLTFCIFFVVHRNNFANAQKKLKLDLL
jgi:hypothetical protein